MDQPGLELDEPEAMEDEFQKYFTSLGNYMATIENSIKKEDPVDFINKYTDSLNETLRKPEKMFESFAAVINSSPLEDDESESCEQPNTSVTKKENRKIEEELHSITAVKVAGTSTRDKPVKCPMCGKVCKKASEYFDHIKKYNARCRRLIKCNKCPEAFEDCTELSEHAQVHPQEREQKCSKCDRAFIRRDHLILHLRTHNGLPEINEFL